MRPRWPGVAPLIALVSCADSTSPSGLSELASFTQTAATAVTEPVVSALFRMAAYVAGGVAGGQRGCTWEFDVPTSSYLAADCGQATDRLAVYRISLPDLPHQGVAVPVDLPLVMSGEMRFPATGCAPGFDLRDDTQRHVLTVCPDGPAQGGWQATLRQADGAEWTIAVERATVDQPSLRTRYRLTLEGPDDRRVILEHDDVIGVERSESHLRVTSGAVTLDLVGFAGATGPDYAATHNDAVLGRIYWAGRNGFVTVDRAGTALPESTDTLLRDARLLLGALARMAGGAAMLLTALSS